MFPSHHIAFAYIKETTLENFRRPGMHSKLRQGNRILTSRPEARFHWRFQQADPTKAHPRLFRLRGCWGFLGGNSPCLPGAQAQARGVLWFLPCLAGSLRQKRVTYLRPAHLNCRQLRIVLPKQHNPQNYCQDAGAKRDCSQQVLPKFSHPAFSKARKSRLKSIQRLRQQFAAAPGPARRLSAEICAARALAWACRPDPQGLA